MMRSRADAALAQVHRIVAEATRFDASGVRVRFGLRSAAGVALVLVAALVLHRPQDGAPAAVGAFIVGFASRQGVYRTRASAMLLTATAMALAAFIAAVSGASFWASLILGTAFGFGAGLLASLGNVATTIGLNTLIALAIFGQYHLSPLGAFGLGGLVFAGGLLQTALLVSVWPLARFSSERTVLAKAYRALSAYAGDFPRHKLRSPSGAAFAELSDTLADPQPFARRGDIAAFEALLVEAERIRATLGALAIDLYKLERRNNAVAVRALVALGESARHVLARIAEGLETAAAPSDWDDSWEALDARLERLERQVPPQTVRDARALAGQLRAAWRTAEAPADPGAVTAVLAGGVVATRPQRTPFRDALRVLRANLSPHSAFAQHGLRLAATIAAAHVLVAVLPLQRGYWLTLTAVLVLRPDFATTFSRGVARLLGTLIGSVVATLVALLHPGPQADVLFALGFATVAFMVFNLNYAAFTTAVTGYVVFLLAFGGTQENVALLDRIEASLLGGALALGAYGIWPTWERELVPQRLADLLDAQLSFVRLVFGAYLGMPYDERRGHDVQLAAWRARSNAEASVDRMLAEPVAPTALTVRAALGVLASSRRLGLAALTLQARTVEGAPRIENARALVEALETSLDEIATAVRARRDPHELPPLRDLHADLAAALAGDERPPARAFVSETDLMVDSINAMADVLHRLWARNARFRSEG